MPSHSVNASPKTTSKTNAFVLQGTLNGHTGAIITIAATEDGKMLASGGTDGTRLWNLESSTSVTRPTGAGVRGKSTRILWVRREDEASEILFYGSQNGYLVCWKQISPSTFEETWCLHLAEPSEITGLAFDSATNTLLVCNRNSVVQSYTVERSLTLQNQFSVKLANTIPKAIAFGEFRNNEKEILVFGLYDGVINVLRGTNGAVIRTKLAGGMIGDAAVSARKGVICLDDLTQGIALHHLDDNRRLRTYEVKCTKEFARARHVCFADDDDHLLVSGSDHGVIYIYDRWSGEIVDELSLNREDWLQTVTATDVNGTLTIIAARSREVSGQNEILLWKKAPKSRKTLTVPALCGRLVTFVHAILVVGVMFLLYQNLIYRK